MDDVFVADDDRLPKARGFKGPFTCLNSARFGIAWGALGAAEDCLTALAYTSDRKQFGRRGGQPACPKKSGDNLEPIFPWRCKALSAPGAV